MIRTLALVGALFASVGAAHAEDQVIVTTAGKAPHIVQAELYRAAWTVCASSKDPLNWENVEDCAQTTLGDALRQFDRIQKASAATLQSAAR
jgi:hypothetical protein